MADKKICPLTHHLGKGGYDQEITDFDYCVEKRCAWWNSQVNICGILLIGNEIALTKVGKL